MRHAVGRVGEDLLGVVDLGALERFEPGDLVERQVGEQAQEAADVARPRRCARTASNRKGRAGRR
jgi:hypothetical protein